MNEKEKMIELLKIAHNIVNFVGMDPWEYECCGKDLQKFNVGIAELGIVREEN